MPMWRLQWHERMLIYCSFRNYFSFKKVQPFSAILSIILFHSQCVKRSSPGQNGRHFAADISKCIFMNEMFCIWIRISMKFVPKRPIDNKSALVQVMAWRRTGDKPLPEPMLTQFTDTYMQHKGEMYVVHSKDICPLDLVCWGFGTV